MCHASLFYYVFQYSQISINICVKDDSKRTQMILLMSVTPCAHMLASMSTVEMAFL